MDLVGRVVNPRAKQFDTPSFISVGVACARLMMVLRLFGCPVCPCFNVCVHVAEEICAHVVRDDQHG